GREALAGHLPVELGEELKRRTEHGAMPDEKLWVRGLMALLLEYGFAAREKQTTAVQALVTLLAGYIAGAQPAEETASERLLRHEGLRQEVRRRRARLAEQWQQTQEQRHPPLIPLSYMEYVPGRPLAVPRQIMGRDHRAIITDRVFRRLCRRYEERFNQFLSVDLNISPQAPATDIIAATEGWMAELEENLTRLLPGDLGTAAGVQEFAENVLRLLPVQRMYSVHEEMLREVLLRFPPSNLMIPLGVKSARELLNTMDARRAFSLANLLEDSSYLDRDVTWLASQLSPENFSWVPLKLICLDREQPYGPLPRLRSSSLNRLTACLTVKTLEPGWGGSYPRLKYFNSLLRRLCAAEQYSRLFYISVRERRNIGVKVQHALLHGDSGDAFSAHNIFESFNHRLLVRKLDLIAERLNAEGKSDDARVFERMAHSWGLSQVLENEEFLSCTPWSWASHSYKGGQGRPEAFSTSVEARCFNHDFLEALYRELGYPEKEIRRTVYRLVRSGRSGESLLDRLLPSRPRDIPVLVQEITSEAARPLQRYRGNPVLAPIPAHDWESRYVLNPGALRLGDDVYLFYRAVGDDGISHIGLAITDGYSVRERLPHPILSPVLPEESRGCEDPRMALINDRVWMLYTAYDGQIAQIAAASIACDDLQNGSYTNWRREGLAFKNIWDKDAILLPERIDGRYLLIHRIEPSMWATWLDELRFPCDRRHSIVMGPRPGRMWDSLKIGAGSQALKTRYGWLQIYHGVDHRHVYRLGVVLTALNAPEQVLYRSPNPVLEPVEDYELGVNGAWVPNVVFSCGAVPGKDKEILEDDDEILVYYGAADSSIGLATARLSELIPEKYRRG
ncbi:MAG: glycosidase, partial [Syntrophomonadaceae bacterium]|nr:glycosidase [Syntrophomonadaceae bacterium]